MISPIPRTPSRLIRWLGDLPRPLRVGLFATAAAILLYMCLAPTKDVPGTNLLWDKAEHATAWFVLTLAGLMLSPRRPWTIGVFAFVMGAGVELLQATMGFGRDGDWRDLVADSLGVAVAEAVAFAIRRLRQR